MIFVPEAAPDPPGSAAKKRSAARSSQSTYAAPASTAAHSAASLGASSPSYWPPSQVGRYVTMHGAGHASSIFGMSLAASRPSMKSTRSSTMSAPPSTASWISRSASSTVGAITLVVSAHASSAKCAWGRAEVVTDRIEPRRGADAAAAERLPRGAAI